MRLSALACISISLAPATAWAGAMAPEPARVAALQMEASLASKPDVYLLLDPERKVLEIKARGAVLDTVPLTGIEVISQQPILGRRLPSHPPIPAIWTVEDSSFDASRTVETPTDLKPAPKKDKDYDEDATPKTGPTATPTPTPTPEVPTSYRSRLDNGWDLWVTDQLPPQTRWQTLLAAVRDGWRRLHGHAQNHIPAITLAMATADAQRIHHLLRTGMPILVADEM
jgi:hypothetical protein